MKIKLLIMFMALMTYSAAAAECPSGYEAVHLEQMTWSMDTCSAGTMAYYNVDEKCNGHIK